MRFNLYMTHEFSTGILVSLLRAGFSVGPVWSTPGMDADNAVECFSVSGEDVRFYERLKGALDENGFSFDYRGSVFPSTGFGAIVLGLGLREREQAHLADLLANKALIASQEDHDLVARYEAEYRARKLFHANLICAARELRLRNSEANPRATL